MGLHMNAIHTCVVQDILNLFYKEAWQYLHPRSHWSKSWQGEPCSHLSVPGSLELCDSFIFHLDSVWGCCWWSHPSSCQNNLGRSTAFFSGESWSSSEMQNIPGKYWDSLFGISHETQDPRQNFPFSTRLLYGIRNLSQLLHIISSLYII